MRMTFRWYGEKDDKITLQQIDQIPGMDGIVGALFDIPVGEVWPVEPLLHIKEEAEKNNLVFKDLESINVHEDIKLGLPSRDKYIENYITSLRNAAKAGIQMVCYNFMPVFDWTRTDLAKPLYDGSTVLAYDYHLIAGKTPQDMAREILDNSNGFVLPGWEPERLKELSHLFEQYEGMDEDGCARIWNTSSKLSFLSPKKSVSRWLFTPMTRLFPSLACRASSRTKMISIKSQPWLTARATVSPSALVLLVRTVRTTFRISSANSARCSALISCISAISRSMNRGSSTKSPINRRSAISTCSKSSKLPTTSASTVLSVRTTAA